MFQKLRVKILILYNTLFQKKKVSNLMRLFIKTKGILPVKTIFVRVYIPQTMNGFNIFHSKVISQKLTVKILLTVTVILQSNISI